MTRFYIVAYLDSFFTKTSGDIVGQGEFYFKCNGKRFPDIGVIQLKANESFDPEPNPVMFAAILDESKKEVKFDFEVWEEDPGRDDKFIDQVIKFPIRQMNQTVELKDKKGKCALKLVIKMDPAPKW
jgi:hypothetical protein